MINAYLIFLQDDCLFNNPTRCIKKNVVYKIIGGNFFFLTSNLCVRKTIINESCV